jgi:HK97 family phage portal protein
MLGAILDALVPGRSSYDWMDDPANMSPAGQFWYTPLGIPEMAGQPTANSHLFVGGCFAATRLLCGIGATSPLNLVRKTVVNGRIVREVQDQHPVHQIVSFRPNLDQTAVQWKAQQIAWQVNWGTTFSEIQRDISTDVPMYLNSIHPRRMRPFRDIDKDLWWHVTNPDGTQSDLKDGELVRAPYIVSEDGGITGLGVAYQARRSIGLNLTMERSEQQASKAGVPRIVVETPKVMSEASRVNFRREWKELYEMGGEGVALLTEGSVAKPFDWKMTDQQHVQRREFLIEEIARWYDIPLAMLRRAIKEISSSIEQQGIDFKTYSLRFLDIWLQELAYKLLTEQERRDGYYFAFDFSDLLRGDLAALSEFYRSMNAIGVYSANDILDKLGENPHDKGDTYFVQGAMRPIDEPYNATEPQTPPVDPNNGKKEPGSESIEVPITISTGQNEAVVKAVNIMLKDTLSRFSTKEIKAVSTAATKPKEFTDFIETFYEKHQSQMQEALTAVCTASQAIGGEHSEWSISTEWCLASKADLIKVSETATMATLSDEVAKQLESWPNRIESYVKEVSCTH